MIKLETVSTTLETMPLFLRELVLFRLVDFAFDDEADFARPVDEFLDVWPAVDLEPVERVVDLVERVVDLDEVARPFFVDLLREADELDLDADPFPDLAVFAREVEDFDLVEDPELLDLPRDDADLEPDDPVERVLLADFARPDELFADEPLFDREVLPDLDALLDLVEDDFAVPFFAVADRDEPDLDELLFARDEEDFDAPLLDRDEADFAVPFFDVDPFADLELLEPDLELDDFFAVAIFCLPLE